MCCSVSPNVEVKFSDTILYAAEVVNSQHKIVHVLGYQNTAQNNVNGVPTLPEGSWDNLTNTFTVKESIGNAMILPFPAVPRTMSRANVLDTKNCPEILKNIADTVRLYTVTTGSLGAAPAQSRAVEIFEAAGIYTVVLAQDARMIPDVLDQVPKEKRPKLNPALFEAYAKWYPNWTIALCCFNNDEAQEALPLLWWYEPMNSDKLFLPALDCHTGNVPSLNSRVLVDHTLAVGSSLREERTTKETLKDFCRRCSAPIGNSEHLFCTNCGFSLKLNYPELSENYKTVYYRNNENISAEIKPYLLPQVIGGVFSQQMSNGDFVCQIDEVRKGIWNPIRTLPPNA